MVHTLRYASALAILGGAAFGWATGCSSSSSGSTADAGNGLDATSSGANSDSGGTTESGSPSDAGAIDAASYTYILIDDMETTTHGPIELAGINPPLSPGYWFNFGASDVDGGDNATPPIMSFTFTALPTPTTTYDGKVSMHAAHQECGLTGLYDVCGFGFEFAQITDLDASAGDGAPSGGGPASPGDAASGHDAAATDAALQDSGAGSDGGDAGPPIPKVTVPFNISQYKGIAFWAKTGSDAGTLDVKVQFPDTDTDPRGGVCNSAAAGAAGPNDTLQCYNSYALHESVTSTWQQYVVLYAALAIDPTFGYQNPSPWDGKKVYGINWQAQRNDPADGGVETEDFWVDDVYFIE